jgi:DNA-binding transcriptional MerR regulator
LHNGIKEENKFDAKWNANFFLYQGIHEQPSIRSNKQLKKRIVAWSANQRQRYRDREMSQERIACLNSIGFDFGRQHDEFVLPEAYPDCPYQCEEEDLLDKQWNVMFSRLYQVWLERSSTIVPKADKQLSNWCSSQRRDRRSGALRVDRQECLDAIGFDYDGQRGAWHKNYAAFVEYVKRHGHPHIALRSSHNERLGVWIRGQRNNRKAGVLSQTKIALLDKLGFIWDYSEHAYRYYPEEAITEIMQGQPNLRFSIEQIRHILSMRDSGFIAPEIIKKLNIPKAKIASVRNVMNEETYHLQHKCDAV